MRPVVPVEGKSFVSASSYGNASTFFSPRLFFPLTVGVTIFSLALLPPWAVSGGIFFHEGFLRLERFKEDAPVFFPP